MLEVVVMGSGPELVIVPGCPQPAEDLLPLARILSRSFCVRLVSLPGWGRSPARVPYTLDGAADDVARAVAGVSGAVWVGSSLGFWRAVHLLGSRRVAPARALVGLAPVVDLDAPLREAFRALAPVVRGGADIGGALVERFLSPPFAARHPNHAAEVARFCDQAPREVIAAEFLAAAEAPDLGATLAALDVPLYVRAAELDVAVPPAAASAVAALVPAAYFDVAPGVGHLLGREDPEGTASAIERWVASLG